MADPASSLATAGGSAPSDSVQILATQATTTMNSSSSTFPPKTAAEWEKYEAEVRARTVPFAQRWEAFTDMLLKKAEKDQEGREYSGDTDSDEEDDEGEDEGMEEDDEGEDEGMGEDEEEPMTKEEKEWIEEPLPGSILAQVYDSDADESAYTDSEDDELDSAEDSDSSSEGSVDEEMTDIDIEMDSVEDSDPSVEGSVEGSVEEDMMDIDIN